MVPDSVLIEPIWPTPLMITASGCISKFWISVGGGFVQDWPRAKSGSAAHSTVKIKGVVRIGYVVWKLLMVKRRRAEKVALISRVSACISLMDLYAPIDEALARKDRSNTTEPIGSA